MAEWHRLGGPLAEGRLNGEFVMCPWHGWEYSVLTGQGPPGYDEETVPVFAIEEREGAVWLQTPPVVPRRVVRHAPHPLLAPVPRLAGAPPRVLGLSSTAMDEGNPRFSTSDALLGHALAHARGLGADTRLIRLSSLRFRDRKSTRLNSSH